MGQPSRLAVPFLGLLGALQGAAPGMASTAFVSVRRELHCWYRSPAVC